MRYYPPVSNPLVGVPGRHVYFVPNSNSAPPGYPQLINRPLGESSVLSLGLDDELHELDTHEDDSNEILQHDQIKQNASKDNCYLVETTAL